MMSKRKSFSFCNPKSAAATSISTTTTVKTIIPNESSQPSLNELINIWENEVRKNPGRICLIDSNNIKYSTKILYNKAKALAKVLSKKSIKSRTIIGISLNSQTPSEIVALFACLLSGLPFLPLSVTDIKLNVINVKESLNLIGLNLINIISENDQRRNDDDIIEEEEEEEEDDSNINQTTFYENYKEEESRIIKLFENGDIYYEQNRSLNNGRLKKKCKNMEKNMDDDAVLINNKKNTVLLHDDVFYILKTSGTTGGKPKYVKGLISSTLNRLKWQWGTLPFKNNSIVARRSPLVFVDSIAEVFGTILGGACLAIPSVSLTENPVLFIESLRNLKVTLISVVPTILEMILKSLSRSKHAINIEKEVGGGILHQVLPHLEEWIVSGESMKRELLQLFILNATITSSSSSTSSTSLLSKSSNDLCFTPYLTHGNITLLNLYGSTEVAGDVTFAFLAQPSSSSSSSPPSSSSLSLQPAKLLKRNSKVLQTKLLKEDNEIMSSSVSSCSGCIGYIPVGYPLSNITIKIKNYDSDINIMNNTLSQQECIETNQSVGEITVEGVGVCGGYLELDSEIIELNKSVFHHLQREEEKKKKKKKKKKIFSTGDIGFQCKQCGQLCVIGRKDNQVKVKGVRVSLEEIEVAYMDIAKQMKLSYQVIFIHHQLENETTGQLIAFISEEGSSSSTLKRKLDNTGDVVRLFIEEARRELPSHYIPASIYSIKDMPTTESGKVNRRMLHESFINNDKTLKKVFPIYDKQRDVSKPHSLSSDKQLCKYKFKLKMIKEILCLTNISHSQHQIWNNEKRFVNIVRDGVVDSGDSVVDNEGGCDNSDDISNIHELSSMVVGLLANQEVSFGDLGGDSMIAVEFSWRINNVLIKNLLQEKDEEEELKKKNISFLAGIVSLDDIVNITKPMNILTQSIENISDIIVSNIIKTIPNNLTSGKAFEIGNIKVMNNVMKTYEKETENIETTTTTPFKPNQKKQKKQGSTVPDNMLSNDEVKNSVSWLTRSGLTSFSNTDSLQFIDLPTNISDTTVTDYDIKDDKDRVSSPSLMSVRWKVNLGKCVDASPLLYQSSIGQVNLIIGAHSRQVVNLNALTGVIKWKREVINPMEAISDDASIEATAALSNDGSVTLISGYDGILHALCSNTGDEVWRYATKSKAEMKGSSFISSNSMDNKEYHNTVFFGAHDNILRCVDMGSSSSLASSMSPGNLRWEIELDGAIYASPLVVTTARPSNHLETSPSSFLLDVLIVATTNGTLYAFDLSSKESSLPSSLSSCMQPPSLLWRVSTPGPLFATPIACGVRQIIVIATVSGSILSLNLITGANIWTRISTRGYFSSPTIYPTSSLQSNHIESNLIVDDDTLSSNKLDGLIVIGCHDGCLSCRDVNTGMKRWNLNLSSLTHVGDVIFSSPFIFQSSPFQPSSYSSSSSPSQSYVAAATQSGLIVIVNLLSGEILHSLTLPGQIFSSPVVISLTPTGFEEDGVATPTTTNSFILYIGCRDDHVYAINIQL